MIACLLEKGLINDFLNRYPSNEWNQIIPSLVQLGIIYLYDNFNPNIDSLKLAELVENILRDNIYKRYHREERGRHMPNKRDVKSANLNKIKYPERIAKPFSDWRDGDDEVFDRSLSKVRSMSSESNRRTKSKNRSRSNSLNPLVYPAWWGSVEDDRDSRVEKFRRKKKKFEAE